MVEAVGMHLSGMALKWYSSTILEVHMGELSDIPWDSFKDRFLKRFDQKVDDPLVKWLDYKLENSLEIANYFQEKIHLGNMARQDEGNQISGLTLGLPARYKTALATAGRISSTSEWLSIAQKLEAAFKINNFVAKKEFKPFRPSTTEGRAVTAFPAKTSSKAPFDACRICAKKGKPNQMHWHRECPHKNEIRVNMADNDEEIQGNDECSLDD